jgi:hypothetical protein
MFSAIYEELETLSEALLLAKQQIGACYEMVSNIGHASNHSTKKWSGTLAEQKKSNRKKYWECKKANVHII